MEHVTNLLEMVVFVAHSEVIHLAVSEDAQFGMPYQWLHLICISQNKFSAPNTQFGWHHNDGRVAVSVECHSSGGQQYKQV